MTIEKVATRSMDNFWQHLEAGHFDRGLDVFRQLGYTAAASEFAFDPDSYYIPNRRGDRFVRPANVSEDLIPVIETTDDRSYDFEARALHPMQETILTDRDVSIGGIKTALAKIEHTVRNSGKKTELASVFVRGVSLDSEHFVADKPTLMLKTDKTEVHQKPICPGVILHELVHVAQLLAQPIQHIDGGFQRELEAYAVQATLLEEDRVTYSEPTRTAASIDQFRRRNLGSNVFVPTPVFTEVFREQDRIGHIVPAPIKIS